MNKIEKYHHFIDRQKLAKNERKDIKRQIRELEEKHSSIEHAIEREKRYCMEAPLLSLASVGRGVFNKSFRSLEWDVVREIYANFKDSDRDLRWIFYKFDVIGLSSTLLYVRPRNSNHTLYEVPVAYLSMSDRDFAKEVRTLISKVKEQQKEDRRILNEAVEREGIIETIRKMEAEKYLKILQMDREIERFKEEMGIQEDE